jgi:hypothetical protein
MSDPPFSCDTAAAALGRPGATVRLCAHEQQLQDLWRVSLDGEGGRLDTVVYAPGGRVSAERGGAAMARYLRSAPIWSAPSIPAQELRSALIAFAAWPAGFDLQAGPRTVDAAGKPVLLPLPDLAVTLETSSGAWRRLGGAAGVSRPSDRVRATLRGGPATPFTWTVEESEGAGWSLRSTTALEP